jgi:hypothetical protein
MAGGTHPGDWSSGSGFNIDLSIPNNITTPASGNPQLVYPNEPIYVPEVGERDVHAGGFGGGFLDNTAPLVGGLANGQISSVYGGKAGYPDPHDEDNSGTPNETWAITDVGLSTRTKIKFDNNSLGGAGGGGGGYGFNGGNAYVHENGNQVATITGGVAGAAIIVNDSGHLNAAYSNVRDIKKINGRIFGRVTTTVGLTILN